ncbi:hypothetical protein MTQ13_05080 [Streptomyces sp. XM4011]|uniref:hypothetical protein n=1 Tax=Streptomyces TaxID=1883 RepID=UPI001FF7FAC2|nr:hypothetical protein [Streptomyces sp. XM4011]MCK1813658.1 hypothetical protein [Streptomyces sp. XM4011]
MSVDLHKGERSRWWGLIVEENLRRGKTRWWGARLLGEHYGTHASAVQALQPLVHRHRPALPRTVRHQRIYREESGFLALNTGTSGAAYPARFVVRELVWDSGKR